GTKQVATPVTFGVLTTIVAFIPLMFFKGYWQVWTSQIPPIVGAVLIFSLIESKFILPSHLKHLRTHRDSSKLGLFSRLQKWVADGLERLVEVVYAPVLKLAVNHRYTTIAGFFALGFLTVGLKVGGHMGFEAMPTIERYVIDARLEMLQNTPFEETDAAVRHLEEVARELQAELLDPGNGEPLIRNIKADAGSGRYGRGVDPERGSVSLEILPPSLRSEPGPTNDEIEEMWEAKVGKIENLNNLRIRGSYGGRRSGGEETEALQIQLRGPESEEKIGIANEIEALFKKHPNINWAHADKPSSREEMAITLKPRAQELKITQRELARQIRQAFFGEEAQRIQRDGDEIRVMVRLPEMKRESMHTFDTLNIQAPDGTNVPFFTIAEASLQPAPGKIELVNGAQVSDVRATPEDATVDILALAAELEPQINEIVKQDPKTTWIWEGFIKEDRETGSRSTWLFGALILALYALLAIPFRSLLQPLVVLLAVPFGVIGAYAGHMILGITPSWLSIFGIMALAGVVVNDSIVLVDFINKKRQEGMDLTEAVLISGVRRFRPIFLTSITTFAGLMPLMFDRAIHAQFLKPMAVSLGFGILFATFITLFLIPAAYLLLEDVKALVRPLFRWYAKPFRDDDAPR
ncbi:MAG: multidrug efflux pump subunit AcrB, partial [Paracoccaceae bacterium]